MLEPIRPRLRGGSRPLALARPAPSPAQVVTDRVIAWAGQNLLNALKGSGIGTAITTVLAPSPAGIGSDSPRVPAEPSLQGLDIEPALSQVEDIWRGQNQTIVLYSDSARPGYVPPPAIGLPIPDTIPMQPGLEIYDLPEIEQPEFQALAGAPPMFSDFETMLPAIPQGYAPETFGELPLAGAPPMYDAPPVRIDVTVFKAEAGMAIKYKAVAASISKPMPNEAKVRTLKMWMAYNTIVSKTFGTVTEVLDLNSALLSNTYAMTESGLIIQALAVEKGNVAAVLQGIVDGKYRVDMEGFVASASLMQFSDYLIGNFNRYGMKGLRQAGYMLPMGPTAIVGAFKRSSGDEQLQSQNLTKLPVRLRNPTQKDLQELFTR